MTFQEIEINFRLKSEASTVQFSNDGNLLLVETNADLLDVYTLAGETVASLRHDYKLRTVRFAPGNEQVVLNSTMKARIWDLKTNTVRSLATDEDSWMVVWSPDNSKFMILNDYDFVNLRTANGEVVATMRHQFKVNNLKFSPDGTKVLTADNHSQAFLWDLEGNLLSTMHHDGDVLDMEFTPDSLHVVTASRDKKVRLWDLNGNLRTVFQHRDWVRRVWVTSDGTRLLTMCPTEIHDESLFYHRSSWERNYFFQRSTDLPADGAFYIWSLEGELLHRYGALAEEVRPSRNDKYILSYGVRKPVQKTCPVDIWDMHGHHLGHTPLEFYPYSAKFSNDSSKLLAVHGRVTPLAWQLID